MQLGRLIESFLLDAEARNLSPKTVDFYKFGLSTLDGAQDIAALDANTLRSLFLSLAEKGWQPRSVHAVWRSIRAFLNWCARELDDHCYHDVVARVRSPRLPQDRLEPASLDDVQAMLKLPARTMLSRRDKAVLCLLVESGLRASELRHLTLADLDIQRSTLLVRGGKGNKTRVAVVGPQTCKALDRYLWHRPDAKEEEPLFLSRLGKALSYHALQQSLARLAGKAGVPTPSPHSLRRLWCVASLRAGVPLPVLQALGGWSSVQAMTPYLKLTTADLLSHYVSPLRTGFQ